MKRKNLSFMSLFMLTTAFIGGCSCSQENNENVSNVVFKVGDKEYSAKELYNELLSTGTGANEAFAKVLRLVVETSMETTTNIQAAADLAAESFEEEVKKYAASNGVSKDDARETLLEEKGYDSVDQMKSDIIYEQKLTRITENYWEENKSNYFNSYIENRLPYLIRHVLVKIDDTTASKIGNNVSASQADAKKLYDVIKRFEAGDKFAYIANQESEDPGSTASGGAYYMDNSYGVNGFVDEFVYGTYAFDTYATKNDDGQGNVYYSYGKNDAKFAKLKGLSNTDKFSEYYANGFNFVNMDVVNYLGEVYNQTNPTDKDYFNIAAVNKVVGSGGEVSYVDASNNLNNSENYYARSIIFNRAFNKSGVSVIGYDTKAEAEAANAKYYVELRNGTESKYILTDENGNPIFFVAARGSNNDIWVHFLTINVSALDNLENAKKFFSLNPNSEDNYTSYVELFNTAGTTQGANEIISEIESYIKSYVTEGTGNGVGEESILKYDMVQHYIAKNNLTYANDDLKNAINAYITNKKGYLHSKLFNSMVEDWTTHTNKLISGMSDLVQMGIKPYECAVLVDSDVLTKDNPYTAIPSGDNLCRYVYEEGYQVQLFYLYENESSTEASESFTKINKTTSNILYFEDSAYAPHYVTIGGENSDRIRLATPVINSSYASKYKFEGWYLDKACTIEASKDSGGNYYVDLSESSWDNNTIFFAKLTEITTGA